MKTHRIVVLVAILGCSLAHASDFVPVGYRIALMEAQIEAQIERVKRAREDANTLAELAGYRIENQLRIAQEQLQAQLEQLELYQEQLGGNVDQSQADLHKLQQQLAETLAGARERIRSEIARTSEVISRLKRMRDRANAAWEQSTKSPVASTAGGTTGSGNCPGTPACPRDDSTFSSLGNTDEGSSGAVPSASQPTPLPPPPPPQTSGG